MATINNSWKATLPPFRKHKKKVFSQIIETGKFIYQIGESPLLRKLSKDVSLAEIGSNEFRRKIEYAKRCLKRFRKLTGMGRGITAVQVGISERFSVIYMPEVKGKILPIINPKIVKQSTKLLRYPEICMSANPIIVPVVRPAWIKFEYYDEQGNKQYWNRKDDTKEGRIYNRVFQHEIDHMDGIINIDKVSSKDIILESDPNFYNTAKFEEV